MPFYSYTCHCGAKRTLQRTVAERDAPVLCYHNGKAFESGGVPSRMTRDIAAPDFHLKGPGWASSGYQ